jgi:hypothetical protein
MPRSCALAMTSGGGGPSALAIRRRHPELEQRLLDELLVLLRNELGQVAGGAFGRDAGGHDHVDAVRAPAGVGVHPVQGGVQLGRVVEPDGAEHPEAAGPADRGGDMLGRAEPDDGMLDAEQVAQGRPHGPAHLAHLAYLGCLGCLGYRGTVEEWAPDTRSRPGAWLAAYSRAQA